MRKLLVPALVLGLSGIAGAGLVAAAPQSDPQDPPGMMDGQGPGGPGHHGFMMRHHWNPAEHLDGRLAFLKAELKIKPAQEGVWSDFASAMRKSTTILAEARPEQPKDGKFEPPPLPARLDRAEQRLQARLDALKAIKSPAKKLYDSLDDTQKKSADELFHGPMGMR